MISNFIGQTIGTTLKAGQTPIEQGAIATGTVIVDIETPIVDAVVSTVAKAVARDNVYISSGQNSVLDALNPPD